VFIRDHIERIRAQKEVYEIMTAQLGGLDDFDDSVEAIITYCHL
jgi:hypothetical protein